MSDFPILTTPLWIPTIDVAEPGSVEAILAAGGGVTPEMLLAVAAHRLGDLDDQIKTVMAAMNERTALAANKSEQLAMLRDAMSAMAPRYDSSGNYTGDDPATQTVTFRGETMTVNELAEHLHRHGIDDAGARAIDRRSGLQNLIDAANDDLRSINSNNELLMIQLQSTMQSRTAIISATTNLLKSLDEGNDAVVANLR